MEIFWEDLSIGRFIIFMIVAAFLLLFFYCLYDVIISEFPGNEGILWPLLMFFAPGVGILAYLLYGRQRKIKK